MEVAVVQYGLIFCGFMGRTEENCKQTSVSWPVIKTHVTQAWKRILLCCSDSNCGCFAMSLSMLPLPQIKEILWYLPFHIPVYVVTLWVKYMVKLRKRDSSHTENIVLICCSSDTTEIKICCLHWNVIIPSVHKWTSCVFVFCVTEGFHCSVISCTLLISLRIIFTSFYTFMY